MKVLRLRFEKPKKVKFSSSSSENYQLNLYNLLSTVISISTVIYPKPSVSSNAINPNRVILVTRETSLSTVYIYHGQEHLSRMFASVTDSKTFVRNIQSIKTIYLKNSKFKASQHLINSKTSNQISNLADIWIIWVHENTAIDNYKYATFPKNGNYLSHLWKGLRKIFGLPAIGYDEWLHFLFLAQLFAFLFLFSFILMLYVFSLAKNSVTSHKFVIRVNCRRFF